MEMLFQDHIRSHHIMRTDVSFNENEGRKRKTLAFRKLMVQPWCGCVDEGSLQTSADPVKNESQKRFELKVGFLHMVQLRFSGNRPFKNIRSYQHG